MGPHRGGADPPGRAPPPATRRAALAVSAVLRALPRLAQAVDGAASRAPRGGTDSRTGAPPLVPLRRGPPRDPPEGAAAACRGPTCLCAVDAVVSGPATRQQAPMVWPT